MGVYTCIAGLVQYGLDTGLITQPDTTYITNRLLDSLRLEGYEATEADKLPLPG